jgi:type II secretion system protein I
MIPLAAGLASPRQPTRPSLGRDDDARDTFSRNGFARAFTLLEVMVAVAFIGIALLALLSLHHSNLGSVIRGQELTRAAMLAQALMTQAEMERFPEQGASRGDFTRMYPGQYPNFRWARTVSDQPPFDDVRRVEVRVYFGPGLHHSFSLTEFMHNPIPPEGPGNQQGDSAPADAAP